MASSKDLIEVPNLESSDGLVIYDSSSGRTRTTPASNVNSVIDKHVTDVSGDSASLTVMYSDGTTKTISLA